MFTGLIEATSKIINLSQNQNGGLIEVECPFADEITIGDSVAVNGICLTVTKINKNILSFDVSLETIKVSALSTLKTGQTVNLERALKANSRLDGHIVSGHIDGTAKILKITKEGFSYRFEFYTDKSLIKYIAKKGSVAINGISLTVTDVGTETFSIEVIPHTIELTSLKNALVGDIVNLETDILSKYVEKFLSLDKNSSKISMKMLEENGYL